MRRHTEPWLLRVGLLLAVAILLSSPAPAVDNGRSVFEMQQNKLCQDLNLTPEKTREFKAVEDKFGQRRLEVIDRMQRNEMELEKSLAIPQVDEGKVKQLVAAITADQGNLFESFRAQRQEEMALLTPVQQGKFILCLRRWHTEIRGHYQKK